VCFWKYFYWENRLKQTIYWRFSVLKQVFHHVISSYSLQNDIDIVHAGTSSLGDLQLFMSWQTSMHIISVEHKSLIRKDNYNNEVHFSYFTTDIYWILLRAEESISKGHTLSKIQTSWIFGWQEGKETFYIIEGLKTWKIGNQDFCWILVSWSMVWGSGFAPVFCGGRVKMWQGNLWNIWFVIFL